MEKTIPDSDPTKTPRHEPSMPPRELNDSWFGRGPRTANPSTRPPKSDAPPIDDPIADDWFR